VSSTSEARCGSRATVASMLRTRSSVSGWLAKNCCTRLGRCRRKVSSSRMNDEAPPGSKPAWYM
jgi:hypothetical protein